MFVFKFTNPQAAANDMYIVNAEGFCLDCVKLKFETPQYSGAHKETPKQFGEWIEFPNDTSFDKKELIILRDIPPIKFADNILGDELDDY